MVDEIRSVTNHFLSAFLLAIIFWNNIQCSVDNGLIMDFSKRFLFKVPKNLPAQVTDLDLSYNSIAELQISDFSSLSKLKVLNLSHNLIRELDFSIFQYNKDLELLDLSHNNLQTISCIPITSLRHLDLSYNDFMDMPTCQAFGKMVKLEYLGLSARRIHKSDYSVFAHLQLDTLYLGLDDLSEYIHGKLPVFNTRSLQIIFPPNNDYKILTDLEISVTESLELTNIQETQILINFLMKLNKNSTLLNLTLNNIQCDWEDFIEILQIVWESSVEYFVIANASQLEAPNAIKFKYTKTSLKALTIKDTILTTFRSDAKHLLQLFSEMNLTALTISDAGLIHMLCPSNTSHFTYLRFSNNSFTDTVFQNCKHLIFLEKLILKSNQFKKLVRVSLMTSHMVSLKYLDMSLNLLQYEDHESKCDWGKNLVELDLSSNKLSESVFRCLPVNIQKIDLQNNQISSISKGMIELNALEEINLASNKLANLPGCGQFRNLRFLNIEMNSVVSPSSEFYQTCQGIKELKAGHNLFTCSCELRQFINLQKQGSMELVGWPDAYVCEYPAYLRGTLLRDFHVSEVVCNVSLLITIVIVVIVVFVATVSFLCIRFDVPWYLKMMWKWTQAKHRIRKSKPEDILPNIEFHAFISYSEHDSEWVKNVLIPNLEKEDGSIRICQHERNFVAGKSIVENIIDCIEKSYKSIFVLSPYFVQSEWCHYELYFAHHKLFSENAESLILIVLEPIPAYIIPARYHKLKALMAKRTYLEWPKEKSKHGLFWSNLRAAIHVTLPNSEEAI